MMTSTTIAAMFLDVCKRFEGNTNKIAFSRKTDGQWHSLTHDALRENVELFSDALLRNGIAPGERVGIISENRTEWVVADFAMSCTGVIDVPIFPTLTAHQAQHIFFDCQAAAVIVSNAIQLKKIIAIWDDLPALRLVITMNTMPSDNPHVLSMQDMLDNSRTVSSVQERRARIETVAQGILPSDLLTLIYTSGTTGNPKGVMLTHGNLVANISAGLRRITVNEEDVFLSYLPMCHSYERMAGYYLAFSAGASSYIAESIESVAELMREVRPTIMTSVPRLFERIRARVLGAVEKDSSFKQGTFRWAMRVGERYEQGERGAALRLQQVIADKLVYAKIRERTGGRLRFFVSGGAALNHEVGRFFHIVGLKIVEGYGLTETSPVIAVHRLNDIVLGTVGQPLDNVEVRIAPDGEILARGPSIMKGYWQEEEATRESIDGDGWLHTGDIGEITDKGHIRITDRKKHLLVSSGGKNMAPQTIESLILQSPFIDQMMLIGDAREYCTALIVPDVDVVEAWAKRNAISYINRNHLLASSEVHRGIEAEINRLQRDLAKYERVRRFAIVSEPFSVENGLLTPTLKVKRKAVLAAYSDIIDHLYEKPE